MINSLCIMNKNGFIILSLLAGVLLGLSAIAQYVTVKQTSGQSAVIRHFESEGNLQVTHNLGCIHLGQVKNIYTPPDLYKAYADCIQRNDYKDATDLFMIAGAYARFDTLRVADTSAHQARTVLIMNNSSSMSEKQRDEWKAYSNKYIPESQEVAEVCREVKRIGPPVYNYPTYMIQHGIHAFSKEKQDPIVPDFNPQDSWQTVMDKGLHCKL